MRQLHLIVNSSNGNVVSQSKNLRGILDFARKHVIESITITKNEDQTGKLEIWLDENKYFYSTQFASFSVLCDWVGNRRSWQGVNLQVVSLAKNLTVCSVLEKKFNSDMAESMLGELVTL